MLSGIKRKNRNVKITIIDPKRGVSFREFENTQSIFIIKDNESAVQYVEDLVALMDERYEQVANGESFDALPYQILIVDELNDLIDEKPQIKNSLKRLAQKARESKIILGEIGAEKLLGKGDMLIQVSSILSRVFGVYLTDKEIYNTLHKER